MTPKRVLYSSVSHYLGNIHCCPTASVGTQVGRPVVNWIGLSFNMANRQKFKDSVLLVRAFLLLGINFNTITTAM